jgi:hypothetical protein
LPWQRERGGSRPPPCNRAPRAHFRPAGVIHRRPTSLPATRFRPHARASAPGRAAPRAAAPSGHPPQPWPRPTPNTSPTR